MLKYLAKRIGRSLITLFFIISLVFCLMRQMPVEGYFTNYDKLTAAQVQAGIAQLGLDKPLPVQLARFYRDALRGDLGVSHIYRTNVPVTTILAEKIPVSLKLGIAAMLLAMAVGIPMGILMARSNRTRHKLGDKLGTGFIVFIQAVPAAVYYLFLQLLGSDLFHLPIVARQDF